MSHPCKTSIILALQFAYSRVQATYGEVKGS